MAAALRATEVVVSYGNVVALNGVSLEVARGEVLALLGPSGSGKTTLLQAAAGFVDLDAGEIAIEGTLVSRRGYAAPPERRRAGVVFQSYALWPHMSVLDTVAFPLERRGLASAEARRAARELLERIGLGELMARRPGQLSGGQQQRVGLARALATDPAVFLFDEPTANLDTALRASLQAEIRAQQQRTGAGALYITHDPAEAFRVADRVAVLRAGRLVQVSTPVGIYRAPADRWVAGLTGGGSVLPATVVGPSTLRLGATQVECPLYSAGALPASPAGEVEVYLRPGWVELAAPGELPLSGRVLDVRFQGHHTEYVLESPAGEVVVRETGEPRFAQDASLSWRPTTAAVLLGGEQSASDAEPAAAPQAVPAAAVAAGAEARATSHSS